MCMVQRWRGLPPTEEAFHEGADPDGWPLSHVKQLERVRTATIGIGEEEEIDSALRSGSLVLVLVLSQPYVAWFIGRYPGRRSRHGALCAPGAWGGLRHCIVLIARRAEGYDFHDPWYPAAGQPFHVPDDDFQ